MSEFTFDNPGSRILKDGSVYENPNPKPRVSLAITQSIPNNSVTNISSWSEVYDTHGLYSSGSTIVIPAGFGGHYHILATGACELGGGISLHSPLLTYFVINGTAMLYVEDRPGGAYWSTYQVNQLDWRLNAGDTITAAVWQLTGASRNVSVSLTLTRLGGF